MFNLVPRNNLPKTQEEQKPPAPLPPALPPMGTLFGHVSGHDNPLLQQDDLVTEIVKPDGTVIRQARRRSLFQWWKGQE